MTLIRKTILITSLFSLISCDLFMKDLKEKAVSISQFASCELDTDAFSQILKKNIKGDLECLREKIKMFIETVETDKPGYVSKNVLKDFLIKGPIDIDPEVVDIVDSVFDLSYLIIGSEPNYIQNTDMNKLIDFLIYFNVHIRETYQYFTSKESIDYGRLTRERRIVFNEFNLIANKLKTIFKKNRPHLARIDSEAFILNFFKKDPENLESIRSLMFLKRVFLGGEKWDLTHNEFGNVLDILPELAQVAFDVTKAKYYTFKDEQEKTAQVFYDDFELLNRHIYFKDDSDAAVFTIYDVIEAVNVLDPELVPIDLTKYPREIIKLKEIFLGEGNEIVYAKELFKLIDLGQDILYNAIISYRIYDLYENELNSPAPISHGFDHYPVNSVKDMKVRNHFASVANNYQFFKGTNSLPSYTFETKRNYGAFFEIMTLEYVLKHVMTYYGQENPNARGHYQYDMTLEQTVALVKDFKWILKDEGLIQIGRVGGGEIQGVADNVVLLSTLFQFQSDGCDTESVCMEIPEITEFVIGLFTAMGIKDFFQEQMLSVCASELDEYNRISPKCFRENFIDIIRVPNPEDNLKTIADYMPELNKYFDELIKDVPAGEPVTKSADYMKFMQETEGFTRNCMYYDEQQTEEVYLRADDAFAVFAGLLNVESTMIKWDLDKNGQMDYENATGKNEVLNAYFNTYEGAIRGLVAPNGGFLEKLSKPIFQFLIKYGRVPNQKKVADLWKLAKIVVSKSARRADAKRVTISTILKVVGEENQKKDPHPFKCDECMRNPDVECAPEDDQWRQ